MERGDAPRGAGFEDFLDFRPGEFGRREARREEEDFTASLEEIQKMDAVLKIKATEEKRAKLARIQAEEESRDLLNELLRSRMPDRIKINVEKFMRLLNEVENAEGDPAPDFKSDPEDGIGRGKPKDKEEEKRGKTDSRQQNAGGLTFVERNIRLAKCGRGTLSITDEEKSRIENLLADVETQEWKTNPNASKESAVGSAAAESEEAYAFDRETKSILSEIDRRLEVLRKLKTLTGAKGAEKSDCEGKASEENEREDGVRGKKEERKKANRLEEINKLLNSMSFASEEEIHPLSEEELGSLVRRSRESLSRKEDGADECPSAKPPPDVITDLVSDAKLSMPKFKYRFEDI